VKNPPINRQFPIISLEFIPEITISRRSRLYDLLCHFNAHDDSHITSNRAHPPLLVAQLQVFPAVVNGQNKGANIHIFLQGYMLRPLWQK